MRLLFTAFACLISLSVFGQHEASNIEELLYENSTPIVHSMSEYTNRGGGIHIPYPILYVHGLVGSSTSWQEMYTFLEPAIGSMVDIEFCLNADGDLSTSNASNDIASFIPNNLQVANQYVINFNCDPWGNCYLDGSTSTYQSNQSGIYKQAEAIGLAIDEICQATGKDKVILLGHSMGGVASREYLQNYNHWQSNDHRVAKLVTSGSPHIGVSFSTGLWKEIGDLFNSIDVNSEAVRDLKNIHTGLFNWVPGVFFWGGEESQDYMYDDIFYWHNVDVNSNGQTGNIIIGLNERSFSDDLEYSCLWDEVDNVVTGGDGDYNWEGEDSGGENLCSIIEHGFNGDYHCEDWGWNVPGNATGGHNELPEQVVETLWALDEPDDYDKSYEIEFNKWYLGFITPQASNAPYPVDYDDYILSVSQGGGVLTVDAEFLEGSEGVELYLYEISTGSYINSSLNNSGVEEMTTNVSAGQYIVEFAGSESDGFSQYFFSVNLQSNSLVNELEALSVLIYPNPVSNNLTVDLGDLNGVNTTIKLYDSSSKLVFDKQSTSTLLIDVSSYAKGLYTLELSTSDKVYRSQAVIE